MTEADAFQAAQSSVSYIWEECKFGRLSIQTEKDFWSAVSERMVKEGNFFKGKFVSLDEQIPNAEGALDRHSAGMNGYTLPEQINIVYLKEVLGGIDILPHKYKNIMMLICKGNTILDVAKKTNLPVHTVYALILDARRFLNDDLIEMGIDKLATKEVP